MVAEHGCGDSRERISERIDEQIVETETSLEAVLASAGASKNSWAQVIFEGEVSVKTLAEESMVLASVTRVLQLETGGAEGQTYSPGTRVPPFLGLLRCPPNPVPTVPVVPKNCCQAFIFKY